MPRLLHSPALLLPSLSPISQEAKHISSSSGIRLGKTMEMICRRNENPLFSYVVY